MALFACCFLQAAYAQSGLKSPGNTTLNSADRDLKSVRSWAFVQSPDDLRLSPTDYTSPRQFPLQIVDDAQFSNLK